MYKRQPQALPGALEHTLANLLGAEAAQASSAHAHVLLQFVLPLWAALLVTKLLLGFGMKRAVFWYNRYYDSSFKRLFKPSAR